MSVLGIEPLTRPLDADIDLPGSKSITNRALLCAAIASGRTRLERALFADDTEAMLDCLRALGVGLETDAASATVVIEGAAGAFVADGAKLDARLSGTTARFLAPVLAVGEGRAILDGAPPLRNRPMGPIIGALASLGASVTELGEPGHLPLQIDGRPLRGGKVRVRGDVSSQFVSGLMIAAPLMSAGLSIELVGDTVSRPYLALTAQVMRDFDAVVDGLDVAPGGYRALDRYVVEPDASAASYFFAAAAICGGRVRVNGLGTTSAQGDLAFVDVLEEMGASVIRGDTYTEVRGGGVLSAVDVNGADFSDTAPTLAVVAAFARGTTVVRGIGFIRAKESDRIAAVVNELRRCGVKARELPDGFAITGTMAHGARIATYEDHRIAMSFALIGLAVPGIDIEDPECVAKTFPSYFTVLDGLRHAPGN